MNTKTASKRYLGCSHCGKQIAYNDYALDFEGLIYCSKQCVNDEIKELNNLNYSSDCYKSNHTTIEDSRVCQFNWDIVDC